MRSLNVFGNPDGAHANIKDIVTQYITLDGPFYTSDIIIQNDLKTRVIAGSKGSGKTVYLRRLQVYLKQNPSVYVNEIERELPSTDLIVRFCQCFPEILVTEKWMDVWKFAILRAVISHILKNHSWNQGISEIEKDKLLEYENIIFPHYVMPMTIYAEARSILSYYSTGKSFDKYTEKKEWDEIEFLVSEILKKLSPIYFFIDSIDEEYENAPMYWLKCQKGLFYRVMRLLRKEIYGNKLHVVISIRDRVMASVCESEHSTRYLHEGHLKLLNWNYKTIQYFFESKVKYLDDNYFIIESYEKIIANWLGLDNIYNPCKNTYEPIVQYILRHTRLLPRDIVIIGNSLAEIKSMKLTQPDLNLNNKIREKILECSIQFGNELLYSCANQINSGLMPKGASRHGYSEIYTNIEEYKKFTIQLIKDVLISIGSDRLSWTQLLSLEEYANSVLGDDCKMFDALWENGGIGYIEDESNENIEVFFDMKCPQLPKEKKFYILRSCVIDALGLYNIVRDASPIIE